MPVNLPVQQLNDHFLQPSGFVPLKHKRVLYIRDNTLTYKPLKETSLWEKVQAWFGYGPLNLGNIAAFISSHAEEMKQQLGSPERQRCFYQQLLNKCLEHNQKRWCHQIKAVCLDTIESRVPSICTKSFQGIGSTASDQKGAKEGNIDFSYTDPHLGFGYVLDGAGHGKSHVKNILTPILNRFHKRYKNCLLSPYRFPNVEWAQGFVKTQLDALGKEIFQAMKEDVEELPALSFAQIIVIGQQRYLISYECADCLLLIQDLDKKTFHETLRERRHNLGLGDPTQNIQAKCTLLDPGAKVIGCSDGIGEFLTLEEYKTILQNYADNDAACFKACEDKIRDKGIKNRQEAAYDFAEAAANCSPCTKRHHIDDRHTSCHDDTSFFSLQISS